MPSHVSMTQSQNLINSWPWLLTSLAAVYVVNSILKFVRHRRFYRGLPTPPHSFLLGNLKVMGEEIKKYPSDFHPQPMFTEIGKKHRLRGLYYLDLHPFSESFIFITDPEVAMQVQTSPNFFRHPFVKTLFRGIVGTKSIFSVNGNEWHQQRSWFSAAFSLSQILALVPGMIEETLIFKEILTKYAVSGEVFSMNQLAMHLTIDIIGRSVGNIHLKSQTQKSSIVELFSKAISWTAGHTDPMWKKFLSPLMIDWYTRKLDKSLGMVIREKYAKGEEESTTKTILDLALKGYRKDRGQLAGGNSRADQDEEFMKLALDNAKVFFVGGHDTTASLVTYTFYYLSKNPKILERVRAEHDEVFGQTLEATIDRLSADPHLLSKLPFTLAVLREILRLHPSGFTVRKAAPGATVTFEGRTYPMENHIIGNLASAMGRDPLFWRDYDPSAFEPDRWLSPETHSMAAWQPFEKGPRNCIGQQLAMTEAKVIMVMILRSFDFEIAFKDHGMGIEGWGGRAYQELNLTAKPKDGIPMRAKLRV